MERVCFMDNDAGIAPIVLDKNSGTQVTLSDVYVSTNDAAIKVCQDGFGITQILSYQVAEFLGDGSLEKVLENYVPDPIPVHIVHREGRFASARR